MRLETEFTVSYYDNRKFGQDAGVIKVASLSDRQAIDIENDISVCVERGTDALGRLPLLRFAQRLKKVRPSWEFAHHINGYYVYRKEDLYTFGVIGYGDFLKSPAKAEDRYSFWSPNIVNERYSTMDNNYRLSQSKDMEVAARKCTTYMRPLYLYEIFRKCARDIAADKDQALRLHKETYEEADEGVRKYKDLLPYLEDIYKHAEIPTWSEGFSKVFDEYLSAKNAFVEAQNTESRNVMQVYIRTNKEGRKHYVSRLVEIKDSTNHKMWIPEDENMCSSDCGFIEDMPEAMARQIAALDFVGKEGPSNVYRETNWHMGQGLMMVKGALYYLAVGTEYGHQK